MDVEKYKTDPDLADFWADLEANGPAAAMRCVTLECGGSKQQTSHSHGLVWLAFCSACASVLILPLPAPLSLSVPASASLSLSLSLPLPLPLPLLVVL